MEEEGQKSECWHWAGEQERPGGTLWAEGTACKVRTVPAAQIPPPRPNVCRMAMGDEARKGGWARITVHADACGFYF